MLASTELYDVLAQVVEDWAQAVEVDYLSSENIGGKPPDPDGDILIAYWQLADIVERSITFDEVCLETTLTLVMLVPEGRGERKLLAAYDAARTAFKEAETDRLTLSTLTGDGLMAKLSGWMMGFGDDEESPWHSRAIGVNVTWEQE